VIDPDPNDFPPAAARVAFGDTLGAWMRRAGWNHDTPLRWGKAAGFPAIADSTFNRMQRGKIANPFPITFLQFGLMNDRLARRDYGLSEDDPLLARIARQRPIEHADGTPWRAADFFAHFVGELDAPTWVNQPPVPTLEDAVAASSEAAELFKRTADEADLPLPQAWQSLAELASIDQGPVLPPLTAADLDALRMVLSGWHTWTPEQLGELLDLDGHLRPLELLRYWAATAIQKR
jgi:hypothetical protein